MTNWTNPNRPYCEFDTECAHGYWLAKFYFPDGTMLEYDIDAESGRVLNIPEILWIIHHYTLVSFNGIKYDTPMLRLACGGANVVRLKECNDVLIPGGGRQGPLPWQMDSYFPEMIQLTDLDMVDIMEVAPGVKVGLKAYMGRMHSDTIQDLPFDHSQYLPPEMRPTTRLYCGNDLIGTRQLRETVQKRIDLRVKLGERYGVDVRSKSDAQMAEAIIKKRLDKWIEKRLVPDGYTFRYTPPAWIRFTTSELQQVLHTVINSDFVVRDAEEYEGDIYDDHGKKIKTGVKIPKAIKGTVITRPGWSSKYKLGIGGLHSQEKAKSHYASATVKLVLEDVASYYPNLIRILGNFPVQLGPEWLAMYIKDIDERVAAKKLDPVLADGLKIFLNGTFGKLFSKHSIFFAPEMGIATTMTGQLALLMLIEALETNGIPVISANTDGIVCRVPVGLEWLHNQTIKWWESVTGLTMERGYYKSVHSVSVNSYVAFDVDGSITRKGMFSKSGVTGPGVPLAGAHPDRDISTEAAIAYLEKGTPIHQTVRSCTDVRKFITLRGVKGGGQWNGEHLGKVVRWYYSTQGAPITYISNGNKVADSTSARPIMKLTTPTDIDYGVYETFAAKLLTMAGVT